ncbi:hypothetical protein CYMTET_52413, partial [Cymbomonas tetramitiformis]
SPSGLQDSLQSAQALLRGSTDVQPVHAADRDAAEVKELMEALQRADLGARLMEEGAPGQSDYTSMVLVSASRDRLMMAAEGMQLMKHNYRSGEPELFRHADAEAFIPPAREDTAQVCFPESPASPLNRPAAPCANCSRLREAWPAPCPFLWRAVMRRAVAPSNGRPAGFRGEGCMGACRHSEQAEGPGTEAGAPLWDRSLRGSSVVGATPCLGPCLGVQGATGAAPGPRLRLRPTPRISVWPFSCQQPAGNRLERKARGAGEPSTSAREEAGGAQLRLGRARGTRVPELFDCSERQLIVMSILHGGDVLVDQWLASGVVKRVVPMHRLYGSGPGAAVRRVWTGVGWRGRLRTCFPVLHVRDLLVEHVSRLASDRGLNDLRVLQVSPPSSHTRVASPGS